ncbi:MAG TPA: hypothetical protein VFP59_05405 [Candidatus Angelobacter sp.]|nr:hypothetical protein [Candidatus Angelobacter sp.]
MDLKSWGTLRISTVIFLGSKLGKPELLEGDADLGETDVGKVLAGFSTYAGSSTKSSAAVHLRCGAMRSF